LGIAGATGEPWFGLPVHRRFKTMILQAENGLVRLSSEYRDHCAQVPELDDWVRVSSDVDFLDFNDKDFCAEMRASIAEFMPDVFVLDPWNRATSGKGDEQDYRNAFDAIKSCLPAGDARPALMIAAHTKKPRDGKSTGRALLNDFSGSLVLGSVPRAGFVLQSATDASECNEFVFTCCKNNNGPLGKPTAWRREGVRFVGPLENFDWEAFNRGGTGPGKNVKIELHHLEEIFNNGKRWLPRVKAHEKLMQLTGAGRQACYDALNKIKSRFADSLRINPDNGEMTLESPWPEED
ncbi:MAG: AAA family ATPase, partial [Roseimicrobium sp.]